MNFTSFYVFGSIVIGVLQTARGVLTIANVSIADKLGPFVAILSFLWVPICISTLVVFIRQKINPLSPLSYLIYNVAGSVVATALMPKQATPAEISPGFVIAGMLFGIYYVFINFQLVKKVL